ncbi:MAG TPA: Rieske 2Fe-2S domain-containing protein [Micropepsaceae bacterium]|jgi:nitrite reductase/ring-hydroxylating ferredoxin subunit|nr:Rieske 2Fe-2S domain-containing protein [Micropepsaceae bacterium]
MEAHLQDGRAVTAVFLCRTEALQDPGTWNVVLGEGDEELDIVIVRTKGTFHAYINSCPHQFIPLETFPNHFLTEDKKYLVCSGHGARFELATGACYSGPCLGKGLDRLAIEEKDGVLYLTEPMSPGEIARNKRASRRW